MMQRLRRKLCLANGGELRYSTECDRCSARATAAANGGSEVSVHEYDLIVVGSGPAGQMGAIAAAKAHKRVAVIDRQP
jgi:NADPH-dependent 2,4-dienoyl-CoA reductase/sulfur reductase-like enzyme